MEPLGKVILDIHGFYAPKVNNIDWIARALRPPDIAKYVLLKFDPSQVKESIEPMCSECMEAFKKYLDTNPDELEAEDYPLNIIEWLKENLTSWEYIDILGRYFPKTKSIELYWLTIILYAERQKWSDFDLGVVVDVHEWGHALVDLGTSADGDHIPCYRNMSLEVSEGLAQFLAHNHLKSLTSDSFYKTYVSLMETQPNAYLSHLNWLSIKDLYELHGYGIDVDKHVASNLANTSMDKEPSPFDFNRHEHIRKILFSNETISLSGFNEQFARYDHDLGSILDVFN